MSARQIRRLKRRDAERRSRPGRSGTATLAAGAATLGATALFVPAADAATFTVTSTADNGSDGTLRKEIQDANVSPGDDVITFASGLSGTITLSSTDNGTGSDIEVSYGGLQIQGPGADQLAVDGGGNDRIFTFYNFSEQDTPASISGLTLTGGDPSIDGIFGGALYTGAGPGYAPELTIADSVLTDNHADGGGGAVSTHYGSLTVVDSTFTDNTADRYGGALYTGETDGDQGTEVVIQGSTISGNQAGLGSGGFATYAARGSVLIESSTISDNEAATNGGGLGFATYQVGGVTIENSTVSGNQAGGSGGGINLGYVSDPVVIENSTISGNSADAYGGGVRSTYNRYDRMRSVRNSTITDNSADVGGGVFTYRYDSPDYSGDDDFNLSSTIVAGNSATTEGDDLGENDGATDSFIVGFSLVGDTSDATIDELPAGSNLFGVDPLLGPLADNGGPTQTVLPAASSPAVDAGTANGLLTDQRGLSRTSDQPAVPNHDGTDGTDIGAVELQAGPAGPPGTAQCQGAIVPSKIGTEAGETITGTEASDALFGAGGDDTLSALDANDCVSGDAGNDIADGGPGRDLVDGGAGNDKLKGSAGKDKLTGGGGKDKLKGAGGKDKVSGGGGKDKINPGKGKDKVKAAGGKDKINTVDGKKDKLNCGGGKDKAKVDAKDKVKANCETVVEL